jgi:hypothetical protein
MSRDYSPNGHHHEEEGDRRAVNAYADAVAGDRPWEIVEFEMNTDPYANMLPGITNINAARTIGSGLQAGRSGGHPVVLAISLLLLLVLIAPVILAVISRLVH